MANTPNIRFGGFTEAWEQRKLGEITSSFSGGTPNASNKLYYGGTIPFIRSGEISSDETELFLTEDGLKNSSAKLVDKGDILYALYGATSGEVSISHISGAINQAILAIKPLETYNAYFIMQWLRKEKESIIGTYLQGGQGNLSGNIVKELMVSSPQNKKEQDLIGQYFISLDNLITFHQRKVGDVATIIAGGTPSTKEISYWEPKKIPWLSSGEVHKKYLFETDEKISEKGLNNSSAKWIEKDSVLIALAGQGKTRGTVAIAMVPLTTNQSIAAIKFDNFIDSCYAFQNLDSRYEELRNVSSGDGTRGGLNKQLLSDLDILFPCLEEQTKIGKYFKNIDDLITFHRRAHK